MPGMVFEAHSTDYQPAAALAALVDDGFAILKAGPGLTFALREASTVSTRSPRSSQTIRSTIRSSGPWSS